MQPGADRASDREAIDPAFEQAYLEGLLAQGSERYVEDRARRNALAYADLPHHRDLAYGKGERQALDLFVPEGAHSAPLLVFLHGGYWRANCKDDRAFLAPLWLRQGIAFCTVNYRIAPHGRIRDMVEDAASALNWLAERAGDFGIDANSIVLSGNSAGGHLAIAAVPRLKFRLAGLVALSGLFDLRPLLRTSVAASLSLDADEAAACSPVLCEPVETPVAQFVGSDETDAFIAQSELFHAHRRAYGLPSQLAVLAGENHFSIIEQVARPESAIGETVQAFLRNAHENG